VISKTSNAIRGWSLEKGVMLVKAYKVSVTQDGLLLGTW
jgi:hypothetical protein